MPLYRQRQSSGNLYPFGYFVTLVPSVGTLLLSIFFVFIFSKKGMEKGKRGGTTKQSSQGLSSPLLVREDVQHDQLQPIDGATTSKSASYTSKNDFLGLEHQNLDNPRALGASRHQRGWLTNLDVLIIIQEQSRRIFELEDVLDQMRRRRKSDTMMKKSIRQRMKGYALRPSGAKTRPPKFKQKSCVTSMKNERKRTGTIKKTRMTLSTQKTIPLQRAWHQLFTTP